MSVECELGSMVLNLKFCKISLQNPIREFLEYVLKRDGLEYIRDEEDESSGMMMGENGRVVYATSSELRTAADRFASCCRSAALVVSFLFLKSFTLTRPCLL